MLPRLLLLLPLLFIYSFLTRAQTFEPGLLVRANGDTLRGEIENSFWVEPPAFIRFRPAANVPSELFEPHQLRAVSFTGGRYFSYEALPFDHAAETQLANLPRGNSYDVKVENLLVEVLLQGPVPLRRVVWNGVTHYLLRRPNRPVLDLSARRYLRQTNAGTWEMTDGNNYRNQLALYFNDCPAAAGLSSPFTVEGIVAVVQAYNQACGPDLQPTKSWLAQAAPRRRMAFQAGLLAGVRYNRIEGYFDPATAGCVDCRPHPSAGLYAELFQPSRTVAIYGELSMSSFRSQYRRVIGFTPPDGFVYSVQNYRALLATARLGMRYFFPVRNEHQWLLSFVFELNQMIKPTATVGGVPSNFPFDDGLDFAKTTLLPALGLGWRAGPFTVGADVQTYVSSDREGFSSVFFGSNYALRTAVSYRLGSNPDAAARVPAR